MRSWLLAVGVLVLVSPVMKRFAILVLLLGLVVSCGGGGGNPASPSRPTSISVTASGETLFIDKTITLRATANGQTVSGTWGTDAPSVATISSTGVVTGQRAGEVTAFFDSQGVRGTIRLRVFPEFNGSWIGSWIVTACQGSNATFRGCSLRPNRISGR